LFLQMGDFGSRRHGAHLGFGENPEDSAPSPPCQAE
jgi:hypothetical protein